VAGDTDKAKVRDAIEATKGYVGTGGVVNMSPPTTWAWT
jgi:branched-chain amino acid transport system substrate-binding protein